MTTTRRGFLASAALPFTRTASAADDRFAPLDKLFTDFLAEHNAPGVSVAVSHNGRMVYSKGFGFADVDAKRPVDVKTLFRIASISKPITAAAVLQLMDEGKVHLDQPVLDFIRIKPPKRLDPRWYLITVRHCLQHTGGWDREKVPDPIAIPWQIAKTLGTKVPVPLEDVIRFTMLQKLNHDPGTRHSYSNVGYLLLGRVVAEASGRHYEEYVRNEVLAPIGITDMQLGRALPEHRAKNEASYYAADKAKDRCLYPPRVREQVPLPDGGQNVEAFEAHGGWIASATDLVKFASAFDTPAILTRRAIRMMWEKPHGVAETADDYWYGCGWSVSPHKDKFTTWHGGFISGTSTLLIRRSDGWNWAVLFNSDHSKEELLASRIDPLMHKAVNEVIAAK